MPRISRSRTVAAGPEAAWRIVGDPNHLPRWWPLVERVENVRRKEFTQVLRSKKGRAVRQDFRLVEDGKRSRRWEQSLEGTPFERFLAGNAVVMAVEPAGEGSKVTLVSEQKLKGLSRMGGGSFMLRRATRKQLDQALVLLEDLL